MYLDMYLSVLAGLFIFAFINHLHVALRSGWPKAEAARAAGAAAALAFTACSFLEYRTGDLETYAAVLRAQSISRATIFVAVVEFSQAYSGKRRGGADAALYLAFAALAILRFILPGAGTGAVGLASLELPWGDHVSALSGSPGPLPASEAALCLAALVLAGRRYLRIEARSSGRVAAYFAVSATVLAAGIAFDLGVAYRGLRFIGLAEASYAAITLLQSCWITSASTKAAALSVALEKAAEEKDALIEEARGKEADLSKAIKIAKMCSWEYDIASDIFTFNDDFYSFFRTTAAQAGGYRISSAEYARRFVHPEDRHLVGEAIREAILDTDLARTAQLEHRVVYADGETGYISVHIFRKSDAEGRVAKTYGVSQDITERRRAEEELRKSLAEKETLLRELHHRTKNNMGVIIALLNLQAKSSSDEELRKALARAEERIHAMALVHQKLYESGDLASIDLRKYILDLESYLISSYALSPDGVGLETDMEAIRVTISAAIPCGLILNELIANAFRHAFPEGRRGTIRISLRRRGPHGIFLEVSDDGAGPPPGFEIASGMRMGLLTVKSLGENQLGGTVEFAYGPGFSCRIEFSEECCE